ncbi:WecB/TagA/CpsF family glycosyltransferase [Rhodoblastus sp.]|jgi:N-acetylglucosaminyldiphosphoundecaprenol N-acetyl-beta-D-mannosaminyltransferase|uniref:WecB/TagA/CpsF family glycosyltransferase n=1 Tax=Rhodoblastus sp. TaxID=1962975 RepID=UPI0025CCAE7D|nr:WecB/TagA/CpsF family glycosyltransferase [Rhodoblastus sp.]
MATLLRASVLGFPTVFADELEDVVRFVVRRIQERRPLLTTFVNPSSISVADSNAGYKNNLLDFDLVLPDGIAFAKAAQWLSGRRAARVSFDSTSLAPPVLSALAHQRSSIMLVGGRPGVAAAARRRLLERFPTLRVIDALDGYGDMEAKTDFIVERAPDVVICGMGAGAQEEHLLSLRAKGWKGFGFTCGGYLDQLNGGFQYYPRIADRLQLRWAYRIWREPRRLGRRYVVQYPRFLAKLTASLIFGEGATAGPAGTKRGAAALSLDEVRVKARLGTGN